MGQHWNMPLPDERFLRIAYGPLVPERMRRYRVPPSVAPSTHRDGSSSLEMRMSPCSTISSIPASRAASLSGSKLPPSPQTRSP